MLVLLRVIESLCFLLVIGLPLACRPTRPDRVQPRAGQEKNSAPAPVAKQRLVVGGDTVLAEVVVTEDTRRVGLMFRRSLAPDEGMLFVFDSSGIYPFWMRNTEIPLSIAFIDSVGRIVSIQDMAPHDERTYHASDVPVRFALEVNQGWFRMHGVGVGELVQVRGIRWQ